VEDKTRRQRYLHQANAVAAWGHITRPFCEPIPIQAALALPVDGGYASARVDGFRYKEILSFGSAYSEVIGSEHGPDGPFDTLALCAIEKLNILDVVTCDRLVARISSRRDLESGEPEITTLGSRFEGLRIGNRFFEELDLGVGVLCECPTWKKLRDALQDGTKRDALSLGAMTAPNGDRVPLPDGEKMPNKIGMSLAPGCGRSASIGEVPWSIPVEQVGTVFLGEFFVSQYSRQLVMIRVELGCPLSGGGRAGGGGGGGDSFP
jgi:hypothetical protein